MNKKRLLYTSVQTDVGKCRKNNEDNFLFKTINNENSEDKFKLEITEDKIEGWLCYGVFDGMGGIENGELASRIMSEECIAHLSNLDTECNYLDIDVKVEEAFNIANKRIVEASNELGMCGTTATVLMTDGVVFKVYHIGDSRAYLSRNNKLYQLTEDHTVAELKRKAGFEIQQITEREHHQLTEFVGADKRCGGLRPQESEWIGLKEDDKILLCSDGLYDMCEDIRTIMNVNQENQIVNELVNSALQAGGTDNITCILIVQKTEMLEGE